MNSFLDTNIIIKNIEYDYEKDELRKKCFDHIQLSKGKFFISFIVKEELSRVVLKRKEIYENVLRKIKDNSYQIDYSKFSFIKQEEENFINSIYLKSKGKNILDLENDFNSEINFLNVSISIFLKNRINDISIKKDEIDSKILSIIHESIMDFADCMVLTSAIQMQQEREIFYFVTADKHFDLNGYAFIKEDSELKKYKFPILKNLLSE